MSLYTSYCRCWVFRFSYFRFFIGFLLWFCKNRLWNRSWLLLFRPHFNSSCSRLYSAWIQLLSVSIHLFHHVLDDEPLVKVLNQYICGLVECLFGCIQSSGLFHDVELAEFGVVSWNGRALLRYTLCLAQSRRFAICLLFNSASVVKALLVCVLGGVECRILPQLRYKRGISLHNMGWLCILAISIDNLPVFIVNHLQAVVGNHNCCQSPFIHTRLLWWVRHTFRTAVALCNLDLFWFITVDVLIFGHFTLIPVNRIGLDRCYNILLCQDRPTPFSRWHALLLWFRTLTIRR